MSKKTESVKPNNRRAAHSQNPQSLKTKRKGSGKGGWGDPMDDLKYLNRDQAPIRDYDDPNYEEPEMEDLDIEVAPPVAVEEIEPSEPEYFQNFQSDVESLSAFKMKVEELINDYFYDADYEKITLALEKLNCPNFFNQVPKLLLWTVVASKKQEQFPAARHLLTHLRSINILSKIQLESAFRRLFHRLNELSMLNQNAYLILVDFGEYCVARNLMGEEFLRQLKKETDFAKDPDRIERLKKHIQEIVAEFFSSGDVEEAVRCVAEMDTPFYNHEVVKRIVSTALDHGNRERELTSQFLARAVGDGDNEDYPIPRQNCELGFIILLQRVEGLYKDVPDVLELLSSFIGRAIVDEVLAPAFLDHVTLLETDMGFAVIHHVKYMLSGPRHNDQLLNVWGANDQKSVASMKEAIRGIIREYLVSRELDEALTAIQELNVPMFHHEIIKQLVPAVADFYTAKGLQSDSADQSAAKKAEADVVLKDLRIPQEIADKAVQIQLAVDLISTALEHNIMSHKQIKGGFKRLRDRMDDFKLDSPLIVKYYDCIAAQFKAVIAENEDEGKEQKEEDGGDHEVKQPVAAKPVGRVCGGLQERAVDDLVRSACDAVRHDVANRAKTDAADVEVAECTPIASKSQVVAGTNLFVKVRVADGQFAHIRIWCKLDSSIELSDVQWGKSEGDEIVYF